jgi:AraC-like DNA-binding protein
MNDASFKALSRRRAARVYTVSYEDLNPVVRIAHRVRGAIDIGPRIIFDHELVLIAAGEAEFVAPGNGADLVLQRGELLFIPPFLPHAIRSRGGGDFEHLAVHFDLAPGVPPLAEDPSRRAPYEVRLTAGVRIPRSAPAPVGGPLRAAIEAVVEAQRDPVPPAPLAVRSNLLQALVLLLSSSAAGAPGGMSPAAARPLAGDARNRRRVERAVAYVQEHFAEPLDAGRLAEIAGVSPSHLTRLFRQQTGHAPMDYLRRVRVQRARVLLEEVDLSIKEIARRVGFEDPFHFSKVFHRLDGLPPSLYREALLAGAPSR